VPYAVEVYTSVAPASVGTGLTADDGLVPVSATLSHFDYGGLAGEGFTNVSDGGERSLTWDFSSVQVGSGARTYIVLQNLGDTTANVTLSFIGDGFAPFNENLSVEAYRRGGRALFEVSALNALDAGTLIGVRVSSDQEIVAGVSTYDSPSGRPVDDGQSSTSLGTPFQGRVEGVVPAAYIPAGGSASLTALNANNSAAVIQLIARTASGDQFSATPVPFIMTAQSRSVIDLATVFPLIPTDEAFSITYVSTTPVTLDFSATGNLGAVADVIAEHAATRAGTFAHFGGGLLAADGSGTGVDQISLFNPFAGETISFTLLFQFNDGTQVTVANQTLGARENVNILLSDLSAVATKAASGTEFNTFGITVQGLDEFGFDPRQIVAQITRTDTRTLGDRAEAVSLLPTLDGEILLLDDPIFDGGAPA